ncbi:NUDIX domain-containing protein [Patescibacteria group bacterium]|nr:NUDIX domain-containing protein [Patescibacteria group bacterium]
MPRPNHIEIILRAIIIDDDKILVCKSNDHPPIYYLPGGHLEMGEGIKQALKREIREELGAEINNLKFLEFFENSFTHNNVYHHEINFLYQVDLKTKKPKSIKCQEGHISIIWLEISELPTFKLLPGCIKKYLVQYLLK